MHIPLTLVKINILSKNLKLQFFRIADVNFENDKIIWADQIENYWKLLFKVYNKFFLDKILVKIILYAIHYLIKY